MKSVEYLFEEKNTDWKIFEYIERSIARKYDENRLLDIYKLTLLKFYSKQDYLDGERLSRAKLYLDNLLKNSIVFPFYLDLVKHFELPEKLANTVIIQYRSTDSSEEPCLRIKIADSEKTFSNIAFDTHFGPCYTKKILLFKNEILSYEVFVSSVYGDTVKARGKLCSDVKVPVKDRKYDFVDSLTVLMSENKYDDLSRKLMEYTEKEELVKAVFRII